MPVGYRSLRHAFSLVRQTDIQTAVADGEITKQRGDLTFSPFGLETIAKVSDAGHFGKDPFATYVERLHIANVLGNRERPCSDLDALFTLAFVMGGHAASQPDALLLPNTWEHVLTWVPHGTKPEMDYTSFLELVGSGSNPGYKEKLVGAWIARCTLSATFGDFVKIAFEGGARERASSAAAMPSGVTVASLMKANLTQLSFGDAGSEANVDGKWASFSLEFNTNPTRVLRSGQPAGEEEYIHRVDRGAQLLTGNVVFELENTAFRSKLLNATEVGLIINLRSDDEVDSERKSINIAIPHIKIADEEKGQIEESISWTMQLDETSILRKDGDEPVTVTITTDIDDTEIFTT